MLGFVFWFISGFATGFVFSYLFRVCVVIGSCLGWLVTVRIRFISDLEWRLISYWIRDRFIFDSYLGRICEHIYFHIHIFIYLLRIFLFTHLRIYSFISSYTIKFINQYSYIFIYSHARALLYTYISSLAIYLLIHIPIHSLIYKHIFAQSHAHSHIYACTSTPCPYTDACGLLIPRSAHTDS